MRYSQIGGFGLPPVTRMVRSLAIFNLAVWFLLVLVVEKFFSTDYSVFQLLGLVPNSVINQFFLWQVVTYMFLHAGGLFHIFFNLVVLWMFGSELERLWGSRFFFIYYMACGIGASLIYILTISLLSFFNFENVGILMNTPVVGASGAIFGLMVAYGWIFKNRIIYVMLLFPMKASTFAILITAIELLNMLNSRLGGPVSNLAHLGGIISGCLFLIFWRKWPNMEGFFKNPFSRKLKVVRSDEDTRESQIWN